MALFIYLHFPALQLDHLQLSAESDRQLPVALVDLQHQLVQLNPAAIKAGLKQHMGLASAAALCPDLQLLPYQPEQQAKILHNVAQQLYQVSSDIALDKPAGLILRLEGMLQLYGGLKPYWQELSAKLSALTYRYQYSCGATPYAAKCLAYQQAGLITVDNRLFDKALNSSPLSATELSPAMQQQMIRLGIHTLGQLQSLPPAELARRFDSQLLSYLGRLRGDYYHALEYFQPEPGFSRYMELLYDISDSNVLIKPLAKLLQQLEQQLRRTNCQCYQLLLSLFFRDNPPLKLSIGSAQGEYKAQAWLALCQLQLENLPLPEPVYGLQLDVNHFAGQQHTTEALFNQHQARMSALQLISLLQARLGHAAVSGLTLQDQHLPEMASKRSLPLTKGAIGQAVLPLRPAFLFTRPQPLTEAVTINQGPERLCPDGWQLGAQRDYYIGRNQQGQWLWLFRTVSQQWFIHGLFS
ncbi:Y-family DNA polymerase [Arsukibacterium indicum]|uniref:DNA polymerase Y family protein n=1 Tax=Arsukibacterium indicum TaxID=2848612 RepID=A0ABS6MIV1_9GAMM|nr:DNA polymerase Y family protein [Arsukibacterium indicum]MBV2128535.1 DNA polymerase Y family protein [Arsukibacterium indicum]